MSAPAGKPSRRPDEPGSPPLQMTRLVEGRVEAVGRSPCRRGEPEGEEAPWRREARAGAPAPPPERWGPAVRGAVPEIPRGSVRPGRAAAVPRCRAGPSLAGSTRASPPRSRESVGPGLSSTGLARGPPKAGVAGWLRWMGCSGRGWSPSGVETPESWAVAGPDWSPLQLVLLDELASERPDSEVLGTGVADRSSLAVGLGEAATPAAVLPVGTRRGTGPRGGPARVGGGLCWVAPGDAASLRCPPLGCASISSPLSRGPDTPAPTARGSAATSRAPSRRIRSFATAPQSSAQGAVVYWSITLDR